MMGLGPRIAMIIGRLSVVISLHPIRLHERNAMGLKMKMKLLALKLMLKSMVKRLFRK